MVNRKHTSQEILAQSKEVLLENEYKFTRFDSSKQGNPVVVFKCPYGIENIINVKKVIASYLCKCNMCLTNPTPAMISYFESTSKSHKQKCEHFGLVYLKTCFRTGNNTTILAKCSHDKELKISLKDFSSKNLSCTCDNQRVTTTFMDLSQKGVIQEVKGLKDCKVCHYQECVCGVIGRIVSQGSSPTAHITGQNAIFSEFNITKVKTVGMDRYLARLMKKTTLSPFVVLKLVNWSKIAKIRTKQKKVGENIDHIIPLAAFDLNKPLHILWANDIRNLRFVPEDYNTQKGSTIANEDLKIIETSTFLKKVLNSLSKK
jgi:hypothetical protein